MVLARSIVLLLLLASIVSFVFYAATGQDRFKRRGLTILTWTLIAAFGFFAVLIVQRIA
ncbi:MAG: hypothetical protein JJD98_01830 [Polaromonas sp.]|nr:hypothetical protein [Polaromonas sp.]